MATKVHKSFDRLLTIVGESSWLLFSFFFVGFIFALAINAIPGGEGFFEASLGQLLAGGVIYALVLAVVVLPVLLRRGWRRLGDLLGVTKRPGWWILWLPVVMWVLYMSTTIIVGIIAKLVLPWLDVDQEQQVGFQDISQPLEYVAAFIALVILPPVAEELLFRGYLFGRIRERAGFWLTTAVVSIVFGLVHLQWNVGIDVAVLSVFLCYLRERTGSVWSSIALHAVKNGVAYFFLFIGPLIGIQLL